MAVNVINPNKGRVYLSKEGMQLDSANLDKYHPNSNVNTLQVNIEDGGVLNTMAMINYQTPSMAVQSQAITSHWYPLFFIGINNVKVANESGRRTFAQFLTPLPVNILNLNLGRSTPMNVNATVKLVGGVNFKGVFDSLGELQAQIPPTLELDEEYAIACVIDELGNVDYYQVDETSPSFYEWVKNSETTNPILSLLESKQYNIFNISVQGGFGNATPLPLATQHYQILWQAINNQGNTISDLDNKVDNVISLYQNTIQSVSETPTIKPTITSDLPNGNRLDLDVKVSVDNDLIEVENDGLKVTNEKVDARVDLKTDPIQNQLDAHIEDLDNPHGVTAEQVDTYNKVTIDNKDTAIMNKANNLENANMFKDVNYNNVNGVLTFTKYDDTTKAIDLPLELLVDSGYYDEVTNELVLVLANGSEIRIPVGDLLTDLDAHNIRFNGSGTNYLVNKLDVESAVKELDTRVKANADNTALKVSTNDIVNNLTSTDTNKPLSANQGKVLQDTKANIDNVAHFERIKLESDTETHSSGYRYTSFGGGATFAGRELYFQHSASGHHTTTNPSTWGVLVMYERLENGTFTSQVMDIGYDTLDGGVRDVNATVSSNGKYLYVKFFTNAGVSGQYGGYICVYNQDLILVDRIQIHSGVDLVVWGNTLQTPEGHLLTTSYRGIAGTKALQILRSKNSVIDDFSNVEFETVATLTNGSYLTEANISYWGKKLVLVSRVEYQHSIYTETSNLEGISGWKPTTSIGYELHAPAFPPYVNDDYLLVSGSLRLSPTLRKVALMYMDLNGNWSLPSVVDEEMVAYSGYNSLVKNRYGYGVMYFEGAEYASGTNLYFKDIDIPRYLPELEYYNSTNLSKEEGITSFIDQPIQELNGYSLREVFEQANKINAYSSLNVNQTLIYENDYVKIIPNAQYRGIRTNNNSFTVGKNYYVATVKTDTTNNRFVIYGANGGNITRPLFDITDWETKSEQIDITSVTTGYFSLLTNKTSGFDTLYMKTDAIVINQNELGIENLTKNQLDYYYNLYQLIKNYGEFTYTETKANKQLEAWIEPTLTSATSTYIRYRKDNFGTVIIEGNITVGTAGTNFTLPTGYRPLTTLVLGDFTFNTNGTVVSATTGLKYINVRFTGGA